MDIVRLNVPPMALSDVGKEILQSLKMIPAIPEECASPGALIVFLLAPWFLRSKGTLLSCDIRQFIVFRLFSVSAQSRCRSQ